MLPITESAEQRQEREHKEEAWRAIEALERKLQLAGLPPLVSLAARMVSSTPEGGHVELGGCSARTALALAEFIGDHAHCTGRILPGEIVSPRVAELPSVRGELTS